MIEDHLGTSDRAALVRHPKELLCILTAATSESTSSKPVVDAERCPHGRRHAVVLADRRGAVVTNRTAIPPIIEHLNRRRVRGIPSTTNEIAPPRSTLLRSNNPNTGN